MNASLFNKVKGRALTLGAALALTASSMFVSVAPAHAAASLVQNNVATNTTSTSYSVSFNSATTEDNLLIAVISSRGNSVTNIGTPSGFTQIGNLITSADTPRIGQAVYYKIADGTETSVSASFTGAPVTSSIQIFEYAGGTFTLQDSNFDDDGGSGGTSVTTGSITTSSTDELIFSAYAFTNNGTSTVVTALLGETANQLNNAQVDSGSQDYSYATADDYSNTAGTYHGNATVTGATRWVAHIAAFTVAASDTDGPIGLTALVAGYKNTNSQTLSWSEASDAGSGFSHYVICYGQNQTDVDSATADNCGAASTWDSSDAANLETAATVSTVITGLTPGKTYYYKIFAVDNEGNSSTVPSVSSKTNTGDSGSSSSSVPAMASIVSPNGGETYAGGTSVNVIWSYGGSGVTATRLSYSTDGGSTWKPITSAGMLGSHTWNVPMVATTTAKLRAEVLLADNEIGASDESDATFTITVPEGYVPPAEPEVPAGNPEGSGGYVPAVVSEAASSISVDKGLDESDAPASPLCASNSLIKLPSDNNPNTPDDSTVYYCGHDGKRYVFPNLNTYFTWYTDFSTVVIVDAETLAQIPLGGNVTYKPGSRMIKLQTDEKVYAVDNGGVLRWVTSEAVAEALYGENWSSFVDDVSDAFLADYTYGDPIF